MGDSLREHVQTCADPACVATRKLLDHGANLVLGKGRHCEFAVLAAAGEAGLTDPEIVERRRAYAAHLGVALEGRTDGLIANADYAIHARHAADGNVTGNPNAVDSINLGSAHVVRMANPGGFTPARRSNGVSCLTIQRAASTCLTLKTVKPKWALTITQGVGTADGVVATRAYDGRLGADDRLAAR